MKTYICVVLIALTMASVDIISTDAKPFFGQMMCNYWCEDDDDSTIDDDDDDDYFGFLDPCIYCPSTPRPTIPTTTASTTTQAISTASATNVTEIIVAAPTTGSINMTVNSGSDVIITILPAQETKATEAPKTETTPAATDKPAEPAKTNATEPAKTNATEPAKTNATEPAATTPAAKS